MNTSLIAKFVGELKDQQAGLAESAMLRPKPDAFEHGVIAGRYQGLQLALDALDSLLRDENEKEQKS